MGDIMRPVPFRELLERIFTEYRNHGTVFGISKEDFYKPNRKHSIKVFGHSCATPLGPAAGPHTQLAQNIISAYMTGGRFIELKTVQIMDYLGTQKMISKPCIDARDEGHNVEWSTEYTLEKAYDEYLKAWFALHLIQTAFSGKSDGPDFIFNMSVGYNLEGIKQPKMQTFIDSMIDASKHPLFEDYREQLKTFIEEDPLEGTDLISNAKAIKGLETAISPNVVSQVTISTMHGCPPEEIESICSYMLCEKHLNTFVKLNPTLLGYEEVRSILDSTGFTHIGLRKETFEHDLQYKDAVEMLKKLTDLAKKEKLGFGVKLTNTLGNINDGKVLPGDERYMSGRALLPISTAVAAKLSEDFGGKLPVSYSGGINIFSVKDVFDTGIRPITLATDMLKPGGYARMCRMAERLEKESVTWNKTDINVNALKTLAAESKKAEYMQRSFRGDKQAKVNEDLPMFNCYVSPCMEACPVHQPIPDYVSLVGEGRYAEALSLIYEGNALPNITCNICDHQCQYHCARMDYEGAINIREIKKIAVEKGSEEYLKYGFDKPQKTAVKAAVVGAGPAGLAAAYFLAVSGFETTVYEKNANAGGVVANIIPQFRIDPKAIKADIDHIASLGVEFVFNVSENQVKADVLKEAGYDFIFYAVGAEKDNSIKLDKGTDKVIGALEFLEAFKSGKTNGAKHVVVTGGGNTAMDSARAAVRCSGTEDVTVVYRRTQNEMPADPEEYALALEDGVKFFFLANPKSVENGKLVCTKMVLGEADDSGRRRPVETDETFELNCDTLITAIGEHADDALLARLGLVLDENNRVITDSDTNETALKNVFAIGDMVSGPSTVVRCIASARKAVESAIEKIFGVMTDSLTEELNEGCSSHCGGDCGGDCDGHCSGHCDGGCGGHCHEESYEMDEAEIEAEDRFFEEVRYKKTHILTDSASDCRNEVDFAIREAKRCLDCQYLCNKCVDVCPNRANIAIDMMDSEFSDDPYQIIHVDAFCNECGNCAAFCNHQGRPYKDKFTLFSRTDDFEESSNSGFLVEDGTVKVRLFGDVTDCRFDADGHLIGEIPEIVRDLIETVFLRYSYLLTRVDE